LDEKLIPKKEISLKREKNPQEALDDFIMNIAGEAQSEFKRFESMMK
jgi:hypothetical protein